MASQPLTEEEIAEVRQALDALESEHQDLDQVVAQLAAQKLTDQLLLQRLKKRKLALKDKMLQLQKLLIPDIPA